MTSIALLFPGTGSQYAGMFKSFHAQYSCVRQAFEEAEDILHCDLTRNCFEDGLTSDTSINLIQAALFVCSVAAYRVYEQEIGIKPSYMAGHSLGEFAALTCAGALHYHEAVRAVWLRGQWMEEATPEGGGLIAAVKRLPAPIVRGLCHSMSNEEQVVDIACYNTPDQVVIAGHREIVERAISGLEQLSAQVILLNAKVPFHTSLMKPASERLRNELQRLDIRTPKLPVLSNVTALPHEGDASSIIDGLALQLTKPVRWEETIHFLQRSGVAYALELGPGTVLTKLNRKLARNIRTYAWDHPEDRAAILGLRDLKTSFLDKCLTIAISTRNDNNNRDEYRAGVVEPYRALVKLQQECEFSGGPSQMQVREAFDLLSLILQNKNRGKEEQKVLMRELFEETDTEPLPLEYTHSY